VETLGSIRGIQNLTLDCSLGSPNFHPFQAVADAVNNAHSLLTLQVMVPRESPHLVQSGILALANAIRGHAVLQEFSWIGRFASKERHEDASLDPVLLALSACSQLQRATIKTKCASSNAVRNLLRSLTLTNLHLQLNKEHWLVVADEIGQGRNKIGVLVLSMPEGTSNEATEAVEAIASAIASAIPQDRTLKSLELRMENGFTDEAGVALAKALTVNKTLRGFKLTDSVHTSDQTQNKASLGAQAYEAFSTMLRVNTSLLTFELPPLDTAGGDQRVLDSRDQMLIEQRLNKAGRGELLSSSQTTREAWVDALQKLNVTTDDDTPTFHVSCLYSLLRLKPPAWMLELTSP
jgi:hypothetical protein